MLIDFIVSTIFMVIGGGVFFYGFNRMHEYRLINDTPTSKIRAIAIGITEINGQARAEKYIKTPFSQIDCVYYKYEIKEYRRHVTTDSKGRTSTTYSWDTIATGERRVPFFVRDETGSIYIEPQKAEINVSLKKVFLQKAGIFSAFNNILSALTNWDNPKTKSSMDTSNWGLVPLNTKGSFFSMGGTVGDRKYYEYYFEPGEHLYIIGTATTAKNSIYIAKGENEPTFIISNKSEKELVKSFKWQMIGSFIIGGVFLIAGIIYILYLTGLLR
jgi:hypothetical protein